MIFRMGAALGVALAAAGGMATAQAQDGGQIVISCYRGPLTETIWDHPRAVFIDSLVSYGYSYPEASALAYRVCRDVTLVGNDQALLDATRAAITSQPPGARR